MPSLVSLWSVAVPALLGAAGALSTSGGTGISGTYDIAGTAHVSISPFPAHDYPGVIRATLSRAPGSGAYSLRLEARGYGCTVAVQVAPDGSLRFPDDARCPLDIAEPDAHGHVDARLRTGRGRVAGDKLELALQLDVNGSIQMRIPSRTIRIFGTEIQSPATWAPTAPVRGNVSASGQGNRKPPDAGAR